MDVNPGGGGYNPNFPPQFPHQRPSWFSRNWFWFVPISLLIVGSPFLCCGGCGIFAFQMVKEPFDQCVKQLNEDDRVTDRLGSPIRKSNSSFSFSDFQNSNGRGHATLQPFEVDGPDGRATVSGRMDLNGSVWSIDEITVEFDDGTEITLNDE